MVKRGLGRGLDVLIPQKNGLAAGRTILNVKCETVKANPYQARKQFDEQKLAELAVSIREHGIIQPVVVRKAGEDYELVAGERRLRAAKLAGVETIPVIIKDLSAEQSMEIGLIENLQRENLNPIEEAAAYQRLVGEFGLTQQEIALNVGKSRSVIANTLRLLNLPAEIQESIQVGVLSSGHGRTLAGIVNPQEQVTVWKQMLEGEWTVRQAEAVVQKNRKPKQKKHSASGKTDFILNDLAETLSRHLSTKVVINGSRKRGTLAIHYFSQDDLERLISALT